MIESVKCGICPHGCELAEGAIGFCGGRQNVGGRVVSLNYGRVTSLALDPIEKKPLARFYPGSYILSVGGFGCNLHCPFCQNHEISQVKEKKQISVRPISAEELVHLAQELSGQAPGNLGVAFTYNEPFINYEFVSDTAKLLREANLKTVLVTNGTINEAPLRRLLPFIDAMNIDLKGFGDDFYRWVQGDFSTVKKTIQMAASCVHVEVTTLVIPGKNDGDEEITALAEWLAHISPDIPLHLSRYFPRYQLDVPATNVGRVYELADIARKYLRYVYTGNC